MSIEGMLSSHQTVLGPNLQNLGKYCRAGFCWRKSYLAHDQRKGWHLVQLNPLQVLLRKIFGSCKTTHLAHIAREWNRHQLKYKDICPHLTDKLKALWSKTYPKHEFPPLVKFFGNSSPLEAQVTCIARLHTDPCDSEICGKVLEDYREGDVILIEGVDVDVEINAVNNPQTKCLGKPAKARGWEHVGYTAAHNKIFGPTLELDSAFVKCNIQIRKLFDNVKFNNAEKLHIYDKPKDGEIGPPKRIEFNAEEREKLWYGMFASAISNLEDVLKSIEAKKVGPNPSAIPAKGDVPSPSILLEMPLHEQLQACYQQFKKSGKSFQDFAHFATDLEELLSRSGQQLEKMKYTSMWTPEASQFFRDSWSVRQSSLCTEIDRWCEEGKRVFLCAGSKHFFPNKGKSKSEILPTLSKYKFTIGLANSAENVSYYSFDELAKLTGTAKV